MSAQGNGPLILVADDEIHTTIMLTRIFERENYRVHAVNDGASALESAQKLLPDLILLDIQMPLMNGFDVLRSLRERDVTNGIPTILITAKARQPSDVAHGLNLGADDYVQKPFDPRELLARVQSKLRARQLELALQRRTQELESLLRIGEELSEYLEVRDLLRLVPYLSLDLLPGQAAVIYQFDSKNNLAGHGLHTKQDKSIELDNGEIVSAFLKVQQPILWPPAEPLIKGFLSGMVAPLEHGNSLLGMLMLLSESTVYDSNHLRLFMGIGRQAALTLRNAQLYEIQANYAQHLEDMVEEQTAELKSAQQLLIRAEKLASLGHLAASIAHEINNPLQPIRINLEDMLEDIQSDQPIDIRAIQTTQESVERIRRIVSQLLEFAGKRNTSNVELQLTDVGRIIEGVVDLNRKFFEKEGLQIVTDLSEVPPIYGSRDQLEQVFMNLTLNAKAAMEMGGILRIRTYLQKEEIVVEFSDNGCGIPPDKINKIFDPFYSTKPNGTGLGLFVSYGIVESHHGKIDVQSKVNKGTDFTIRLPVHQESSAQ